MAETGTKFDRDKTLRYELIPPEGLEALAELYAIGAKKYGDRNWEKGLSWCRVFGAMMRHAWAWFRGEKYDPIDKQHHMIAVAWNALALYTYELRKTGQDDRPRTAVGEGQAQTTTAKPSEQRPKDALSEEQIAEAFLRAVDKAR